jgi:hypothetical protein
MRQRNAASITGAAVAAKGPAQLMTAAEPASARSRDAGSSTVAGRISSPAKVAMSFSLAGSRPERMGVHPRCRNSATTKRPVCPYAPKTVAVGFVVILYVLCGYAWISCRSASDAACAMTKLRARSALPVAAGTPCRNALCCIACPSISTRHREIHPRPPCAIRYRLLRGSTQCAVASSFCETCSSTSSQCSRSSLSNSCQRSSGKKILASLNSTRRRVPGIFSASQ